MYWTVQDDGKLRIFDGQNGNLFIGFNSMASTYASVKPTCSITRLDNCEPDWDAISHDSVVRNTGVDTGVRNIDTREVVSRW